MKYAKLLKTTISANYVWHGDRLYINTKWQALDEADFAGKVRVDFEFGYQRITEDIADVSSFTWRIYPEMYTWKTGGIYETAGAVNIPQVWGGTRHVYISLLDDNGSTVPFLDENNEIVMRAKAADIEFCFASGSDFLRSLVKKVETKESEKVKTKKTENKLPVFEYESFRSPVVIKVREIASNKVITNILNDGFKIEQSENILNISSKYISCSICKSGEKIILNNVCETDGYELLCVYFPYAAMLKECKIVNFVFGGRLADTKENYPQGYRIPYDVINAMGIYDDREGILVNTDRLDFVLHQSIQCIDGNKYGVIGVELTNRVAADKKGMKSVEVCGEKSVELIKKENADWKEFAKILRGNLRSKRDDTYKRCIFYKFMLDHGDDEPIHSLEYLKKLYSDVANVCDNQRQIVYIVGWQKGGHDWSYPEPFALNDAINGAEELKDCIENAKQYNAIVSLHDNFEDAYLNNTSDKSLIARDNLGEYYKGWLWSGGLSYIISPKKYYNSGAMQKRVKWLVDTFGIEKTYHIDVTTSEMRRYDFSEDTLSGADENLEYKKKIFEEFNKYGIDVTSETVAYHFIGKTGHGWMARYNGASSLYIQEEKIPLTPMLYHGIIPYAVMGANKSALLKGLSLGLKSCWGDSVILDEDRIMSHYILSVPMLLFENLKMEDYTSKDGISITVYEDGSKVITDMNNEEYEVIYKGKTIAKNWQTYSPGENEDVLYLYSLEDMHYRADCVYHFYKLTKDGAEDLGTAYEIDVKAKTPVKGVKIKEED